MEYIIFNSFLSKPSYRARQFQLLTTLTVFEENEANLHYLLTCMRYVEENPVRAGMVVNPGAYRWSSYSGNALGKLGFDYDWLFTASAL